MRLLAVGYFSGHQGSWASCNLLSSQVTHFLTCQPCHIWNRHLLVQSHMLYLVELILSQMISDRVNILPSPASESPQRYTFSRPAAVLAWFPWPPSPCRCPECNNRAGLPARSWVPRNSGLAWPGLFANASVSNQRGTAHSFCRACRPGAWGLC